jgi:hypothetical protein
MGIKSLETEMPLNTIIRKSLQLNLVNLGLQIKSAGFKSLAHANFIYRRGGFVIQLIAVYKNELRF